MTHSPPVVSVGDDAGTFCQIPGCAGGGNGHLNTKYGTPDTAP